MFLEGALAGYFRLLTFTGILPISIKKNKIVSTKFDKCWCALSAFSINLIIFFILIFTTTFDYYEEAETIQDMTLIQEYLACVTHNLTHIWLFCNRQILLKVIKTVLTSKLLFKNDISRKIFQINFIIFLSCNFAYHLNSFVVYIYLLHEVDDQRYLIETFLALASHETNFFVASIILSFYTCLVKQIENNLFEINEKLLFQIKNIKLNYFEIQELLRIRNNLLELCKKDISKCFGIPFTWMSLFALLPPAHIISIFFWVYKYDGSVINFIFNLTISTYYILPSLIVHIRGFSCNNLRKEVRIYYIY